MMKIDKKRIINLGISMILLLCLAMNTLIKADAVQTSSIKNEIINPASTEIFEISYEETILHTTLNLPEYKEGETIPFIILMHGLTGASSDDLMEKLACEMVEDGYAVLRFDFNGHGESSGTFEEMTITKEIEDAEAVLAYVKENYSFASEIILMGHSQGGVVAGMTAGRNPSDIDALILLAPAASVEAEAISGTIWGTIFDPENIPKLLSVYWGVTLSDTYLKDAQTLQIYEVSKQYEGPVCIIHGKEHGIISYTYSEQYNEIYENSELHLIEKANHLFSCLTKKVAMYVKDFL